MTKHWVILGIAVILALVSQVSELHAFDSPVPTPQPTEAPPPPRPTPPLCLPDCWTEPGLSVVLDRPAPAGRSQEEGEAPRQVQWALGWTAPAWDPLEVDYQVGPE